MTFLDRISQKANEPQAIFHRYRVAQNRGKILHFWVEGYLDKSVFSILFTRFGSCFEVIVCMGKKNMDIILGYLSDLKMDSRKVGFFRDRDFDEALGCLPEYDHLFVTCGYSIENYIFSIESIRNVFSNRLSFEGSAFDIDSVIVKYQEFIERINQWCIPLYAANIDHAILAKPFDIDRLDVQIQIERIYNNQPCDGPLEVLRAQQIVPEDYSPSAKAFEIAHSYSAPPQVNRIRGKLIRDAARVFIVQEFEQFKSLKISGADIRYNKGGLSTSIGDRFSLDYSSTTHFNQRIVQFVEDRFRNI